MKIKISAESTVDLTKELLAKYDISTLPFQIFLGDKNGLDGEITSDEIIAYVDKTGVLPKTGAINVITYEEYFAELLKENDAVVHFSLSSELSSSYNNAVNASKNFKNVYVIDSSSLSTGIALLCIYAKKLADAGEDAKDIYEKCLKRIPSVQASFVLNRLDYLYKGGRCSGLALFGANLLKIRPQIIVKDGKMVPGKKYRGNFDHVVKGYVADVLQTFNTPDLSEVFITYTTAEEELIQSVKDALVDFGFQNIHITRAGGTITSHCGENCLGVLFINDGGNV